MGEDNDKLASVLEPGESPGAELPAVIEAAQAGSEEAPRRPQVTFMGNSYDLTSVVAVATGGVIAFSCVTCNMGFYCLPVVPIILGLVSLLSARDSVDPDRTRLLSWLGIGAGALVLVIMVLALLLYIGFIFLAVIAGSASQG